MQERYQSTDLESRDTFPFNSLVLYSCAELDRSPARNSFFPMSNYKLAGESEAEKLL